MPRGSKLNRPSTLSAIRTSWVDSFTFERYVTFPCLRHNALPRILTSRTRTVRLNLDSPVHQQGAAAVMRGRQQHAADLAEADTMVAWVQVAVAAAVRSMSPTFVTSLYTFDL